MDRIDRALARIEAAAERHRAAHDRAAGRHVALTGQVRAAIAAIDDLIARERDA